MAVTTFAKIQHRRGAKVDLPPQLHEGELGFCVDTRELFIGNSNIQGGNTQVLTDSSNLISVAQYQFVSDTSVMSVTGTSANQPTVRSLQAHLDDAWVNVKAYGAQGDGISDDTLAIQRAITDLYTKTLPLTESESQARKTIWFPSGTYVVSESILLYPECALQGENAANTVISLESDNPQLSVIRLCDSLGQTGANQGTNGAQLCEHVVCRDLTLHAQDAPCVVLLERPNLIMFDHCVLSGTWQTVDAIVLGSESVGVQMENLGLFVYGNVTMQNCVFRNLVWGMSVSDPVQNILFDTCHFEQLDMGVRCTGTPGPQYVKVHNSTFDQIVSQAINVQSTTFVNSLNNMFLDVNTGSESIYWAASTSFCSSMSDQFVNTPGVLNMGTNNLIVNTQQSNMGSTLIVTPTVSAGLRYVIMTDVATGVSAPLTSSLFTLNPDPVAPKLTVQAELAHAGRAQGYRQDLTTPINVIQSDDVVGVNAGAQVNLPLAPISGKTVTIKHVQGSATTSPVLIQPALGASVENLPVNTPFVMNVDFGSVTIIYNQSLDRWLVI